MDFNQIEQSLGYAFKDAELLKHALTHRSFSSQHNERLEFLGDSILNAIIANYLYINHQDADEGLLTRMRANLVSGVILSKLAQEKSFGQFLRLGKGEESSGGRQRQSLLEDVVEALIGAIFLDSSFEETEKVVLSWFETRLKKAHLRSNKNYKSLLQEWLQARNLELPQYRLISSQGEEHKKLFTVECSIAELKLCEQGFGSSHKKAEQCAAQKILKQVASNDEIKHE